MYTLTGTGGVEDTSRLIVQLWLIEMVWLSLANMQKAKRTIVTDRTRAPVIPQVYDGFHTPANWPARFTACPCGVKSEPLGP